jgi:hypothetical protein
MSKVSDTQKNESYIYNIFRTYVVKQNRTSCGDLTLSEIKLAGNFSFSFPLSPLTISSFCLLMHFYNAKNIALASSTG